MKKLRNGVPYERTVEGDRVFFKAQYKAFFVMDEGFLEDEEIIFRAFEIQVNEMYNNYEKQHIKRTDKRTLPNSTRGMINKLIEQNPYSFSIYYNEHKTVYSNPLEQITQIEQGDVSELDAIVLQKIAKTDTWIWLRIYYQTPVGFFDVHHYDLEKAIDIAAKSMKDFNDRQNKLYK